MNAYIIKQPVDVISVIGEHSDVSKITVRLVTIPIVEFFSNLSYCCCFARKAVSFKWNKNYFTSEMRCYKSLKIGRSLQFSENV